MAAILQKTIIEIAKEIKVRLANTVLNLFVVMRELMSLVRYLSS